MRTLKSINGGLSFAKDLTHDTLFILFMCRVEGYSYLFTL